MSDLPTHSIIVKAHIWRDAKLLLLRRCEDDDLYPGFWDIPGGSLLPREGARTGLAREIAEETGLTLTGCRPLTVWDFDRHGELVIGMSYLAACDAGTPRLSAEHTAFEWMAPDDLDTYRLAPNLKQEIAWIISKGWHR